MSTYRPIIINHFCDHFVLGMMEANPEYQLIVQANNLSAEIDNEVSEYSKPPQLWKILFCTLLMKRTVFLFVFGLIQDHIKILYPTGY